MSDIWHGDSKKDDDIKHILSMFKLSRYENIIKKFEQETEVKLKQC